MSEATWSIYLTRTANYYIDASMVIQDLKPGEMQIVSPSGSVVLKCNETGEVVVLDSGTMPKKDAIERNLKTFLEVQFVEDYVEVSTIEEEFEKIGIDFKDVSKIAFTHLHFDHSWNLDKFRNDIPIYVQKKEVQTAITSTETAMYYQLIPEFDGNIPWIKHLSQMQFMEGEYEVAPGIHAFPTPGHTAGHQSFAINTKHGVCVYAGDMYYNSYNYENGVHLPTIYTSKEDWLSSHEKIMAMKPVKLFAMHNNDCHLDAWYGND